MKRALFLILLSFCLSLIVSGLAGAKAGDPPPVENGAVIYSSHHHTVTATHAETKKKLWEIIITMEEYRKPYNPKKERDVQWNIIESLNFQGDLIVVKNSKGEVYFLEKRTGKQVQPTRK